MFKVEKRVLGRLGQCYSIAPLFYRGKQHILVASDGRDQCRLYGMDGELEDVIWSEPGGVMTMMQIPGSDGQFLATQRFYSPDESDRAKLVLVTPTASGWDVKTLIDLPFVHRFDILERNGVYYLIVCVLKTGHKFKGDWSTSGVVYATVLPDDLSVYHEGNPLPLTVLKDHLWKNHGYVHTVWDGVQASIVSADQGVFLFVPPETADGEWEIRQILDQPASDAVLVDLDQDGKRELVIISQFHGNEIMIFREEDGTYKKAYEYEHADFSHSIYGGDFCGIQAAVIGHRAGTRDLLAFYWDEETHAYAVQKLDQDCGSANVYRFVLDGKDIVISTNHEIDEIAWYTCERNETSRKL
ncbi:MAG: hypothetical protein LUE86_00610 [Clostridiales bacterium]|nr:hypothetical protein [Clostridiales bacterium]